MTFGSTLALAGLVQQQRARFSSLHDTDGCGFCHDQLRPAFREWLARAQYTQAQESAVKRDDLRFVSATSEARIRKAADALCGAFTWECTREGHAYWQAIRDRLNSLARIARKACAQREAAHARNQQRIVES